MERRTCWQNCFGPGGDEPFLSDGELLAINVNLSPLCDRLRTISNTLKAFWRPDQASHNIDRELLSTHSEPTSTKSRDVLTEILRQGAREMLAMAIENEVAQYIADHEQNRDANGHHMVVRNGHLSARTIQTGVGPVEVQQPRVNDKRINENGQRIHFSSKILSP